MFIEDPRKLKEYKQSYAGTKPMYEEGKEPEKPECTKDMKPLELQMAMEEYCRSKCSELF